MNLIERMTKCADGMDLHYEDDLHWRANILREGIAEIERLRAALESIAKNTCCDKCQEAALVAKSVLNQQSMTGKESAIAAHEYLHGKAKKLGEP